MRSPRIVAMRRPVALDPVKPILSMPGLRTSASEACRSATMTLITPFGIPAALAASANNKVCPGASGEPLITTVQPAISAGATLNAVIMIGPFQGMIAPTTPTGSRTSSPTCAPETVGSSSSKGKVSARPA